jgi:hemerythrin-like domain-containing protein
MTIHSERRANAMNDSLKLLKSEHREARDILHDLKSATVVQTQTDLLESLTKLLERHWALEFEFVYPLMKAANLLAEANEAEVEHELQRECLEQLNLMRGEPGFVSIAAMLAGAFKQHAHYEEKVLLPALRKALGDDEWEALGDRLIVAQSVVEASDRVAARETIQTVPARVAKPRKPLTLTAKKPSKPSKSSKPSVRSKSTRPATSKKSSGKTVGSRK